MYNIKCHVTDCPMNFNVLLLHKPDKISLENYKVQT